MRSLFARAWRQRRQIVTFLIVGGASSVVDFGIFFILSTFAHFPPWLASAISFLCAFVVNYRGNRDLVFKAGRVPGALPRYVLLVAANWVISTGLVAGFVAAGLPGWGAKIISMVVVATINYLVLRAFVFKGPVPNKEDLEADGGEEPSSTKEDSL